MAYIVRFLDQVYFLLAASALFLVSTSATRGQSSLSNISNELQYDVTSPANTNDINSLLRLIQGSTVNAHDHGRFTPEDRYDDYGRANLTEDLGSDGYHNMIQDLSDRSRRFDPNQLFEVASEEDNQLETLVSSPNMQGGYSSGKSGQASAGVFVGYSTGQGQTAGWDRGDGGDTGQVMPDVRTPNAGVSSNAASSNGQSQDQMKDSADPHFSLSQEEQLKELIRQQQQQQQLQQQQQQQQNHPYNSLNQQQQQQYTSVKGQGTNAIPEQQITAGQSRPVDGQGNLYSSLLVPQKQLQQPPHQGTPAQYTNLPEDASLGSVDQLGDPAQLSSQDFSGSSSNGDLSVTGPGYGASSQSVLGDYSYQANQMFVDQDQQLPHSLETLSVTNHHHHQQEQQQNENPQGQTLNSDGTSNLNNLQQQLEDIQRLIIQLQQQQQILFSQQQLLQQQPSPTEESQQSPIVFTTQSSNPDIVGMNGESNQDFSGEIDNGKDNSEENGNQDNRHTGANDFGNTAGSSDGSQTAGGNPAQINGNGHNEGSSSPVFVAGGDVNSLYGNKTTGGMESSTSESENANQQARTTRDVESVASTTMAPTKTTSAIESRPTDHSDTSQNVNDNGPAFDPDAVNDLAKQEFNPLNPMDGVDLQQYLGYQSGNSGSGFNPTKLNTQLAQQGLQYGTFGATDGTQVLNGESGKGGNLDQLLQQTGAGDAIKVTPTAKPRDTTVSSVRTEASTTSTTSQPAQENSEKPSDQPSSSSSSASSSSSPSSSSSSSTQGKPQSRPTFGDLGGGVNLMNPSNMIGMTSSGNPGMTGVNPREMFGTGNRFGTNSWGSTSNSDTSAKQNTWFGTDGPVQGLTRPIMGNPLDPMGVMTQKGSRRRRSTAEITSLNRPRRETVTPKTGKGDMMDTLFKAFGFDPNRFSYLSADRTINNGLGGCCSTGEMRLAGGAATGGGAAHSVPGSASLGGLGYASSSSNPKSSSGAVTRMSSLALTDFGITDTAIRSRSSSDTPAGRLDLRQVFGLTDQDSGWTGQWPDSNGQKSGPDTGQSHSTATVNAARQLGGALQTLLGTVDASSQKGRTSAPDTASVSDTWDGTWETQWPGVQGNALSEENQPPANEHVGSIGSAISNIIEQGLRPVMDTANDRRSNKVASGDTAWDSRFSSQWNDQFDTNE